MSSVLSKKYTNPSADIIEVLAGLDAVDKLMNDFSNSLDTIIKTGARGEQSPFYVYDSTLVRVVTGHDIYRSASKLFLPNQLGKHLLWTERAYLHQSLERTCNVQ